MPQKFGVIDNADKDTNNADKDTDDNDDELSACRNDSNPIIKPETYDSENDDPFDFFQYQRQDGVVIKLEKDDAVYVETPYEPADDDDDDDDDTDDDDVIIVESSNPLAFKPKRFPIKVTRYAHIVSEEYIGDNDNDDDDDESSQPPSKKIKL
uniref:Uncharacterized protein n=1 Tax=Spodoptera exigua multiple nucleopolyhedrovirus TaxID=10454 RepID=A0A6N0C8D3_9ABAC|nr:hypothetical protein [Spodoptera exigua multiple nucleopolyhedrovirus]